MAEKKWLAIMFCLGAWLNNLLSPDNTGLIQGLWFLESVVNLHLHRVGKLQGGYPQPKAQALKATCFAA